MPKEYNNIHPEIDRDNQRHRTIRRYIALKRFKSYELKVDDKIFLENFKTAISLGILIFWDAKS